MTASLRAWAEGLLACEAAVELLIGHRCWLDREDFLALAVECLDDGVRPMAALGWAAAVTALDTDRLPCSGSDAQMLRLAAGIAGGVPVDLGDALSGLDRHNAALVAAAVVHAAGHPGLAAWPTDTGIS
ncbi:MAG TPA: hypothetical protein VIY28_15105 [Pseudonocardiaceae bacterium]